MVAPRGADLTELLPPAEERRLSDYEAAYLALLDVHVPVAIRLARLQDWARRVTGDAGAQADGAAEGQESSKTQPHQVEPKPS